MSNLSNRSGIVIKDFAYWKKRLFASPLSSNKQTKQMGNGGLFALVIALTLFIGIVTAIVIKETVEPKQEVWEIKIFQVENS